MSWANALVGEFAAEGVPLICLRAKRSIELGWVLRLRRLLASGGYDVVHVHSPFVAGVVRLVVRTLPTAARPPTMSTEHCTWWSYVLATRWLNALTCRMDVACVAVSQQVRDSVWRPLREHYPVLVHGLLPEALPDAQRVNARPSTRRALGLADDEVIVVTIANYRKQKGYRGLLEAARIAAASFPQLRFLVIGYGPLEKRIKAWHAELGLADRVLLLGYREDVMELLCAGDIFVLASHYEGGPIAVLEALAAGLPVVAGAVGFVPDVMTDGVEGFLVRPLDPAAMAERIVELAKDPQLRQRMSSAARVAGTRLDMHSAVRELERLYAQVAQAS
jgi:glycosyltransferase involved in cell wall biosynthesis